MPIGNIGNSGEFDKIHTRSRSGGSPTPIPPAPSKTKEIAKKILNQKDIKTEADQKTLKSTNKAIQTGSATPPPPKEPKTIKLPHPPFPTQQKTAPLQSATKATPTPPKEPPPKTVKPPLPPLPSAKQKTASPSQESFDHGDIKEDEIKRLLQHEGDYLIHKAKEHPTLVGAKVLAWKTEQRHIREPGHIRQETILYKSGKYEGLETGLTANTIGEYVKERAKLHSYLKNPIHRK